MESRSTICKVILVCALIGVGCAKPVKTIDREAEIKAISGVIDNAIGWFKTKDFDLMYTNFAQDSSFLEVHPDSTIVKGFDEFEKNSEIFRNPEFLYLRHDIRDLRITLSRSGDTAWFFCMLDDVSTWKDQQVGWLDTRWTGTLEKRDGRWVIVQQHFSFAAK
jgi:ketosteroid isomerase-like protein